MSEKIPTEGVVRVDTYRVMAQAVESGVAYGWNRAHKHVDDPDPENIKEEIERAVITEICEWFRFGDDG